MQVEKDRSSHFGGRMHELPLLALPLPALAKHRRGEKHPSKRSKLISIYPGVYHKYMINPSPSHLSAGKSLGIKPSPAAQVLYCLSFFSADKRSGSGIYCMHSFPSELNASAFMRGNYVGPMNARRKKLLALNHLTRLRTIFSWKHFCSAVLFLQRYSAPAFPRNSGLFSAERQLFNCIVFSALSACFTLFSPAFSSGFRLQAWSIREIYKFWSSPGTSVPFSWASIALRRPTKTALALHCLPLVVRINYWVIIIQ